MTDDIESLKVHKIPVKPGAKRRLSVAGQLEPAAEIQEAFGGEGNEPVVAADKAVIASEVEEVLKSIYDPEIPVNIFDLGLIYGVSVNDDSEVEIKMTLTAPACPVAGAIVSDVARRTGALASVRRSHVRLVWDPPWTRERMSDEALLELGLF